MDAEIIHGPTASPATRRGQIARAAIEVCREKSDQARRELDAARRDLRNKLRLTYRIPYHEWQQALEAGDGRVTVLLERYYAKHCDEAARPRPSPVAFPSQQECPA